MRKWNDVRTFRCSGRNAEGKKERGGDLEKGLGGAGGVCGAEGSIDFIAAIVTDVRKRIDNYKPN